MGRERAQLLLILVLSTESSVVPERQGLRNGAASQVDEGRDPRVLVADGKSGAAMSEAKAKEQRLQPSWMQHVLRPAAAASEQRTWRRLAATIEQPSATGSAGLASRDAEAGMGGGAAGAATHPAAGPDDVRHITGAQPRDRVLARQHALMRRHADMAARMHAQRRNGAFVGYREHGGEGAGRASARRQLLHNPCARRLLVR